MSTSLITIILLILLIAVLDLAAIVSAAEGERFDELNLSDDIIDYEEWDDLDEEIERGDIYADRKGSG